MTVKHAHSCLCTDGCTSIEVQASYCIATLHDSRLWEAHESQKLYSWRWASVYLLPDGPGSMRRAPRDHSDDHNNAIDDAVDEPCSQIGCHSDAGGHQQAQHPKQADVAHILLPEYLDTLQLQHPRELSPNACQLTICVRGFPAPCLL